MGYCTTFSLETSRVLPEQAAPVAAAIDELGVFDEAQDGYACAAYTQWSCWQEDMCALSAQFPNVLFTLHGNGEESEDLWCAYFSEGKCQYEPAAIVYALFDPDKLKPLWTPPEPPKEEGAAS